MTTKPTKKRGGRKPLYEIDPTIKQTIIYALSTGVKVEDACAYARIAVSTFYEWCQADTEFSEATTRARAEGRIGAASVVRLAATNGDIAAAEWYLERTDPATWGRKDMLTVLGVDPKLVKEAILAMQRAGMDASDVFNRLISEVADAGRTDVS